MKRAYKKPVLDVEMFQLDAELAAGCSTIIELTQNDAGCSGDMSGMVFTDKGNCGNPQMCYQSFTAGYFNS